jgi:hypothetical protein
MSKRRKGYAVIYDPPLGDGLDVRQFLGVGTPDDAVQAYLTDPSRAATLKADGIIVMPYEEYRQSIHWRRIGRVILERDDFRCVLCNRQGHDIHHRTYKRLGHEDLRDLVTLCYECHVHFHEHRSLAEDDDGGDDVPYPRRPSSA